MGALVRKPRNKGMISEKGLSQAHKQGSSTCINLTQAGKHVDLREKIEEPSIGGSCTITWFRRQTGVGINRRLASNLFFASFCSMTLSEFSTLSCSVFRHKKETVMATSQKYLFLIQG